MDLGAHLAAELDDVLARLSGQVLDLVPPERQLERLPASNSIAWGAFHTARHAELALEVLGIPPDAAARDAARLGDAAWTPGAGLQEVEQTFFVAIDPVAVRRYHAGVFAAARRVLAGLTPAALDRVPDPAPLAQLPEELGWLRAQWLGQPVSFLARWPLTAHLTHHTGEAITYRNQMGLSPFR